jgi:hypothetical protein
VNRIELVYEYNHKEDKEIEEQHLDAMPTNYDEELKLLEEWLVNPGVEKDYTEIANKFSLEQCSGMHSKEEIPKASREAKEPLVFQTNYLFKHVII